MNKLKESNNLPKVVELHRQSKLRELPQEQRLGVAKDICVELLALCGVSAKSDPSHHVRSIRFIRDTMLNFSKDEIIFAFEKYLAGDFKIEAFQQLNSVVIGRVMSHFTQWKREEIHKIKEKEKRDNPPKELPPPNFDMIEACDRVFKEFLQHKKIIGICSHVYSHIYDLGLLPKHTPEFKKNIEARAIPLAKAEKMQEAQMGKITRGNLKGALKKIEEGKDGSIVRISKKLILEEFFNKLNIEGKNINDVC